MRTTAQLYCRQNQTFDPLSSERLEDHLQAKGTTIAEPIRLAVTNLRKSGLNDEGLFRISPKQIKLDKVNFQLSSNFMYTVKPKLTTISKYLPLVYSNQHFVFIHYNIKLPQNNDHLSTMATNFGSLYTGLKVLPKTELRRQI